MEWYYYVLIIVPILIVIIGIILYVVHKLTSVEDYQTQLARAQKIWAKEGDPLLNQYNDIVFDKKGKQVYKGLNPKERPPPKDGEPLLDQYDNPVFDSLKQQVFFKAQKPTPQLAIQKPLPVAQPLPVVQPTLPLASTQSMMMPNFGVASNAFIPQKLPPELMMSIS